MIVCALQDLLNIARTTLSSKILTHDKDHFAELAVDAVMRLKGSTNLESINLIKKPGGTLRVRSLCAGIPCQPLFHACSCMPAHEAALSKISASNRSEHAPLA